MRVRISTLPNEGKTIKAKLDRDVFNARLKEGRQAEVDAVEAPEYQVVVKPSPGGSRLRGSVTCRVSQVCGRCGEAADHVLHADLDWSLRPSGEGVTKDDQDDVGIYSYGDDHFDLDEALYEALVLQISPVWRPDLFGQDSSSHRCRQDGSGVGAAPLADTKLLEALRRAGLMSAN